MTETLKKAAMIDELRRVAKRLRGEALESPHLSLDDLRIAVFRQPGLKSERKKHIAECDLCRNLIIEEQENNPLYVNWMKHRAGGGSDEDYWAEMQRIWDKIREEDE